MRGRVPSLACGKIASLVSIAIGGIFEGLCDW